MPARPSRSYPWPVEGANVEDSEEVGALQRNMLPEYVPDHVSLETCSVCEEATGEVHSMALQSPHEAAFQAMDTPNNEFSSIAIGASDGLNRLWRGTFLEDLPMATIEETIPGMSPAMQFPYETDFQAMDTPNNELSNNAIGVSDGINQFWRGTFLEDLPMATIEETIPGMSPAMQFPYEADFQAMDTPNNELPNNAVGVSDELNRLWRGTFLENPPMAIEDTILEMSPAMQSPYEAASDTSNVTMNNPIDAEAATMNSTFERVWGLMERRRRQRRECVVAGIAEEDWNLNRLADVFPTRFTDEQWVQLLTEFSAEECQRLFVLEVAYWRAIDSEGQTASVP
ncbi:hypothetical protein E4U60_002059 [Claviceps pazoutovae]|uniref:Uncharacterized protein n=1 Tax=Claviceps pazoutovae TaxID=1649127 RepID=A0A9P7SJU4_9HYPO|nr:hypothetical protein E4U60_002059 [Claviceps pazoutovae]